MKKKDLRPIEQDTPRFRKRKRLIKLAKVPILKQIIKKALFSDGFVTQTASPIPINLSLGTYEDQIVPRKVAEYFIEKAGTILLIDCPCRTRNECKNHDIHLGCTWFGEGAKHVDLSKWPGAHFATKEEALERERLAYENGLVPHFGKLRGDAAIYDVLEYEDQFMDICHCCSCCCVASLIKYGPEYLRKMGQRMEGVEVKIDPDKCTGCGACFKNCIYDGLKMKDGKATINQDHCMGCGRCEMTCKNGAVSITIDDYSRIDELIERFESKVDISG